MTIKTPVRSTTYVCVAMYATCGCVWYAVDALKGAREV